MMAGPGPTKEIVTAVTPAQTITPAAVGPGRAGTMAAARRDLGPPGTRVTAEAVPRTRARRRSGSRSRLAPAMAPGVASTPVAARGLVQDWRLSPKVTARA